MLSQQGLTLNDCNQNSVLTEWYVDLVIDGQQIIKELFYTGYGILDVPTPNQWRFALLNYLPQLINYGYSYSFNSDNLVSGNILTITNLNCLNNTTISSVSLYVGINININCAR
jgi:hypothetical protein